MMRCLALGDWVLEEREIDVSSLWLMESGANHTVRVSWAEDGHHIGWYVNLEEPFTRTERRLQTMDLMLDIVIDAEGPWHWKDEEEFQAMIDWGHLEAPRA